MRRFILFAIFLTLLQIHLSVQNGICQWIPTASIDGRFVQCFVQKGTAIFAGTGTLPTPVTVLLKQLITEQTGLP